MKKPTTTKLEVYDLMSITDYVSEKYNLHLNYNDIWHWFVDLYEPDNGSHVSLGTEIYEDDKPWVKEMKKYLELEFGDDIALLIEW